MKITKSQLKQIIKEELEEMLRTAGPEETSVTWDTSRSKTTRPPGTVDKAQIARWHSAFQALPQEAQKWHKDLRVLRPPDREKQLQDIAVRSSHSTDSMTAIKALEAFYEKYGVHGVPSDHQPHGDR